MVVVFSHSWIQVSDKVLHTLFSFFSSVFYCDHLTVMLVRGIPEARPPWKSELIPNSSRESCRHHFNLSGSVQFLIQSLPLWLPCLGRHGVLRVIVLEFKAVWWLRIQALDSERTGFRSQKCHLLSGRSWASDFIVQSLSFHIWKMGIEVRWLW